jgi:hypothetical protein
MPLHATHSISRASFQWNGKGSQFIKMICPRLHHLRRSSMYSALL